jgi:hydrogenase/urease accessory protein HupE
VALIAPLPLSTWLIPYHTVVLLPAFVLLIVVAMAPAWPAAIRVASAVALIVYEALRLLRPDEHYRGAVYLIGFVFTVLALGLIRRHLGRTLHPVDSKL